jgi:hypothetical protein
LGLAAAWFFRPAAQKRSIGFFYEGRMLALNQGRLGFGGASGVLLGELLPCIFRVFIYMALMDCLKSWWELHTDIISLHVRVKCETDARNFAALLLFFERLGFEREIAFEVLSIKAFDLHGIFRVLVEDRKNIGAPLHVGQDRGIYEWG